MAEAPANVLISEIKSQLEKDLTTNHYYLCRLEYQEFQVLFRWRDNQLHQQSWDEDRHTRASSKESNLSDN